MMEVGLETRILPSEIKCPIKSTKNTSLSEDNYDNQ